MDHYFRPTRWQNGPLSRLQIYNNNKWFRFVYKMEFRMVTIFFLKTFKYHLQYEKKEGI